MIVTEPTTPLIFHAQPGGTFSFMGCFMYQYPKQILQDSSIFKEKKLYWQNMSTIASEIARSNDVFIKHNFDNHDGEVPVWAANYQHKSKKGNLVNPSQKMLASWIQGVSVLRNMCAHNSRI